MRESEFRRRVVISVPGINSSETYRAVVAAATAAAKEAGATFEPESRMRLLSGLFVHPEHGLRKESAFSSYGNAIFDLGDAAEILRRCKAVEEALTFLKNSDFYGHAELHKPILAILEGTK